MKKFFKNRSVFHYRRLAVAAICSITMLTISGCQKTPEESIVKEKDFDKMIEAAKQTEGETDHFGSLQSDLYTVDINDESLKVKVTGEANVDIPQTDKMSIIKIKQKEISQDMIDRLVGIVAPDEKLYDGSLTRVETKADIEKEIQHERENITNIQNKIEEGLYTEEDAQVYINEYQRGINRYQEKYERAPSEIKWENYLSDGKIAKVKELYDRDTENEFYEWEYSLNKDGDVFYVISDGKNGDCISIFAQNNTSYGNCLRYRKCKYGYAAIFVAMVGEEYQAGSRDTWNAQSGSPSILGKDALPISIEEMTEHTNESASILEEEAREKADEFIGNMELENYSFYQGNLCCEIPDIRFYADGTKGGDIGYHKVYIFKYLRNIDGVLVNNIADIKQTEGWDGDVYVKNEWPGEMLTIYVNDDGVVGMDLDAPLEVTEVVVDQSSLKQFDEVKDIFEQMVVISNAKEYGEVEIKVQKVTLGYTRISAKDNYAEGYLIPVWDFRGTTKYTSLETEYKRDVSILTINAIDGTIINRLLGY